MIFIVFLILGVGAEQDYILGSRAPTDSCDDINNCRRLFNIIWGCATTIFAATWVSVHPNMPPPNQSWLALLWQRLKMMLVAVIAPEVMVGFAARQFVMARYWSNKFKISKTHGFFVCMGGFVTHGKHPIVDREQLRIYASAIKEIQVGAIKDKSKGDALSKAVALFQGLWFITQCIARATQHPPVTELEVATLAFAVVNIFIWLLWWGKPLDVQDPIILGTPEEEFVSGNPIALVKFSHPFSSNSVPSFFLYTEHAWIPSVVASFVGAIFGTIHCAAWNSHFPSADEKWMWWLVLESSYCPSLKRETTTLKQILQSRIVALIPLYIIACLFLLIIP
ncbi:hypothetical protein B0H14DRAFT_2693722 [Mycena olivaceomarginata]|nr:hypothetical protein B0H14DRAFT_2693722 [Mycena olivaceomarginata]